MVHTPGVLARRERLPTPTGELTDGAAIALQVGKVDQALRIYRDLERMEEENPTWSLRVAECYRRLSQRDGELSALMRAASRYEQRGFVREALALWKRVQMVDPSHASAGVAVERLEPSRGLGLDRMRSSFPPGLHHPASYVGPLGAADAPDLPLMPTIPAPAPVPAIDEADELDVPIIDAGLETASGPGPEELSAPVGEVAADQSDAAPGVSMIAALRQVEAALGAAETELEAGAAELEPPPTQLSVADMDGVSPELEESPVFVLVPRKPAVEEAVPVTMRVSAHEELEDRCVPPVVVVPPLVSEASVAAPEAALPAEGRARELSVAAPVAPEPPPAPCSVVMTPVVPVVAELPPPQPGAEIAPLPIISVGAEADAEVEFLEAEVLPCILEIDHEW